MTGDHQVDITREESPTEDELRERKSLRRADDEFVTIRMTTNHLYDIRTAVMFDALRTEMEDASKEDPEDRCGEYTLRINDLIARLPFVNDHEEARNA